jgi:hypothetical protein
MAFSQLVAVETVWTAGLPLLIFVSVYFALNLGPAGLVWVVPVLVFASTFIVAGLYYALKAGARLAKRPELANSLQRATASEFRTLLTSDMNVF